METVGETEMIQTFHKLSVELMEMYTSATSDGRGEEVRTATWSSHGPHNRVDFRRSDHTQKAKEYQKEHEPQLIIRRPM